MNVGITGSSGFLGKHLIKELRKRKITFSIFDRKEHNLFNASSLKNFVSKNDIIVHLAGVNKDGDLEDALRVNILGTKTLLDAIIAYNKNIKFIFASSFGVYQKHDIFGLSKKIAEELIREHASKHKFKSVILRFSNIYGLGAKPFRHSALTTFVYLVKKGEPITLHGDGTQERDYLYVDDAINALVESFRCNSEKTETYDVCSGSKISLNELLKIITKISKKTVSINKEKNFVNQSIYNCPKKLRYLLNWRPEVSLEEGLEIVINQLRT